jgi:hypothetical protein
MTADAPSACPEHIEKPKAYSPRSAGRASLAPAANARSRADRVPTPAIGALAVLIVAAGVLRAIFSSPPSEEEVRVAQEAAEPASPAKATLTVVKSARKAEPPLALGLCRPRSSSTNRGAAAPSDHRRHDGDDRTFLAVR